MKHRIRVSGIVRRGEQILLVEQQNPDTGTCRWTPPGGGLEHTDADIFAGVEREVFEETGLRVRAGRLRFISETASVESQLLSLDIWIECQPTDSAGFGEPTLAYTRPDDNIVGIGWWTRIELRGEGVRAASSLLKDAFWEGLDAPEGQVAHLGRKE